MLSGAAFPNPQGNLQPGVLTFPLKGYTPYTCPVTAVFDHCYGAGETYGNRYPNSSAGEQNGIVDAFNGEEGKKVYGSNTDPKAPGYQKDADGTSFFKNGPINYVGVNGQTQYLNYDGSYGIDYKVKLVPVLAPQSGTVVDINESNVNDDKGLYVTIWRWDQDRRYGLLTECSHLDRVDVRLHDKVVEGQQIGVSGNTGGRGTGHEVYDYHLHFVVGIGRFQYYAYVDSYVDPYGWKGAEVLWKDSPTPQPAP
jgi:murein DD-endopeptidase MepM/ murein hydrolase activator NlpD